MVDASELIRSTLCAIVEFTGLGRRASAFAWGK